MTINHAKKWKDEDRIVIIEMYKPGCGPDSHNVKAIASKLGRKPNGVYKEALKIGLGERQNAKRAPKAKAKPTPPASAKVGLLRSIWRFIW